MTDIEQLRYPIGKFKKPSTITKSDIEAWIETISGFPQALKAEVDGLTEADLQKRYRLEGWNIRQLIHHCADSHMNSLIRFKWALTEDTPTIKPYYEERWAELPDSKSLPIDSSMQLLESLHHRWVHLLRSLSEDDLQRQFIHPDSGNHIDLKTNIGIYAWHCAHHLAHIRIAKRA